MRSASGLAEITPVGEEVLEQFEANIVVDGDGLVVVAPGDGGGVHASTVQEDYG